MRNVIPAWEQGTLLPRSIRGRVAVGGVSETKYYRHGQAPEPEVKLAPQAILAACVDAGVDPRAIDGFASYSNDRNDPSRLAAALGIPELRFSNIQWGGGGTWPHSAEAIERTMGHLSDAARARVLGLNAARLFGFEVRG